MRRSKIPLFYYSLHRPNDPQFGLSKAFFKAHLRKIIRKEKEKENYGDLLSKYLVEKISGKAVRWYNPEKNEQEKNFFAVGSILTFANDKSIVWGTGIIDRQHPVADSDFRAVRGPQTRARLINFGYECPEIYGDPALLLPLFYNPTISIEYNLGIVPHFRDYDKVVTLFGHYKNIKIINLLTDDVEKTTDEVLQCRKIITSSLHGLVIAHAYQKPSRWMKFSNRLHGDGVKFQDYLESVKLSDYPGEFIRNIEELLDFGSKITKENDVPLKKVLERIQNDLMLTCPFI